MRLDKYISSCKNISRKDVKKLIKSGAVTLDGKTAKSPDINVCENSEVVLSGEKLIYREFVYIMLNKPQGYICATEDKNHKIITELIGGEYAHFDLFPVGRLDIDTEGLLILTNDGAFSHALTSPNKNIYKKYFAVLDKPVEESDIAEFEKGMEFKDFTAKSAVLSVCENKNEVYIKVCEGKFHQVKRMCQKVGKTVTYLKRTAIGALSLDPALKPGEYRELTPPELEKLTQNGD